ncbi:hypothetical protein AAFN88_00190 [Pelagibius sp. CAU 1746]|uniref:hypothetical protein n=1 Tax=Pelagibius sp. CAU 1746 TaxID=3140370 RepID=UPI00325ABC2D
MNASPASRQPRLPARAAVLCCASALCVALWAAAPGAVAQDAPISLFPPTVAPERPAAAAGDQPSLPSERAAETPQVEGEGAEGIEIDRLGELDPEALGILDLGSGGFGPRVWAGSPRPLVESLLAGLPAGITSPTLHSLATRLLLTSAPPPGGGPADPAGPTVADALATVQKAAAGESGFLRLRAERLYALGALAGLNRLLALVPQRVEDPWLARTKVDGLLLAGKDSQACGEVPAGLARYPRDLYWAKAQIYCQFLAEQGDQAMLGLDLLREQAPDGDPAFFVLADGFISGTPGRVGGEGLTPLNLAILRRTGGAVSAETVAGAGPPLLHGIAQLAGGDHAVHAAAVERLAEVGALPGERLAGAYAAFEFTEADLADALAQAEREGGVSGRALLYRAANRESLAATKAEILRAALLSAEADGRSNAVARALKPVLTGLAPSPELAWFAPQAARALFRLGQFERAGGWLSVLRIDGLKDPESQAAYDELTPLRRLAGAAEPLSAESTAESPAAAERRLLMLMLSRALGQEEPLSWAQLAQDGAAARPLERLPSLLALGDAAAEGKRGESVLLAVDALGVAAPADSHPLALGYAVSALAAVGLGNEARALAIEAALAARP